MKWPCGGFVQVAFCLLALAALSSCTGPVVTAVGESDDLIVIVDETTSGLADVVVASLEAPGSWLLDEPAFKTTVTTVEGSGDLKNIRHILLVGTWDGGSVGGMIRKVFPGLREDDPPALHLVEDVWAKGQIVGAVMGKDAAAVTALMHERGGEIRDEYEAAALVRLSSALRKTAVDAGMAAAMSERFGWSVSPPTGYDFFTTSEGEGFIFFRRQGPDRTVFVHWTDGDPGFVSEQFTLSRREELAARYLDGDTIEWNRPVEAEQVEFLGLPAIRISGWWGNRTLVGGGPFRTYCFYEPSRQRVYLVDISLFAPGFDKTPLMRNLDAIAHTFTLDG
jgi:hypothetical protein